MPEPGNIPEKENSQSLKLIRRETGENLNPEPDGFTSETLHIQRRYDGGIIMQDIICNILVAGAIIIASPAALVAAVLIVYVLRSDR